VVWVQQVSPRAFPLDLGFTYLVIAVLAGKGGLLGLGLSAVLLEGGRLFSIVPQSLALYLGPIALIFNVTRYQEGFNGLLRQVNERGARRRERSMNNPQVPQASALARQLAIRLPVVAAGLIIAAGFGALVIAWYRVGATDQVSLQNQEIVSGGLGGLGLVIFGSMLLLRDAFLRGRAVVQRETLRGMSGDIDDGAARGDPGIAAGGEPGATAASTAQDSEVSVSPSAATNGGKTTRRRSSSARRTS
jgi:hypothetical protein